MAAAAAAAPDGFSASVQAYLSFLRAEILQAQKMRMQAQAAKIVFLGGLFAYALPRNDWLALLVSPFAAFIFDCMGYGLTYNIQEIGAYIRDNIEPVLPQGSAHHQTATRFSYWETAKRQSGRRDWGRLFARVGNYAVTSLVCVVSFVNNWSSIRVEIAISLLAGVLLLYGILLYFEFRTRDLSRGVSIPSGMCV